MALLQGLALGEMTNVVIRPAHGQDDLRFLRRMLCWAGAWRSEELDGAALAQPGVSRYIEGWSRPGDWALIAESEGERVGAAWYRLFSEDQAGYGFVDEQTPEVTIGVEPAQRRAGIGRTLLEALSQSARAAGYPALSLSVEEDNPALHLYERVGFERRAHADGAWTMVLSLA